MGIVARVKRVLITLIRVYQWTLSRLLGPCCRFYPSCSDYAIEALRTRGCVACHPFHPGGFDPVPPAR